MVRTFRYSLNVGTIQPTATCYTSEYPILVVILCVQPSVYLWYVYHFVNWRSVSGCELCCGDTNKEDGAVGCGYNQYGIAAASAVVVLWLPNWTLLHLTPRNFIRVFYNCLLQKHTKEALLLLPNQNFVHSPCNGTKCV